MPSLNVVDGLMVTTADPKPETLLASVTSITSTTLLSESLYRVILPPAEVADTIELKFNAKLVVKLILALLSEGDEDDNFGGPAASIEKLANNTVKNK